jgi:ribosomal subunit interface protein
MNSEQVDLTPHVRARLRELVERLERFFDRITSVHVTIQGPSSPHQKGPFSVRITVAVPRQEIVVTHQHADDLDTAMRDSFDAAVRQLEDYSRRVRGDVKSKRSGLSA